MVRTCVEFSGLTSPEAIELIPEEGVAGFVVEVPESPRNLSLEAARALVEQVPAGREAWAITANPAADLIHRLFDEVGVDRIEVYGTVPPGLEFLEIHHIVPSLPIPAAGTTGPEPVVPPAEDYSRLHLDSVGDPLRSGSREPADWEMSARIVDAQPGRKLVLAGGITPENVAEALGVVRPWGVDVSAGIEREAGRVDPEKARALVQAITEFESSHT